MDNQKNIEEQRTEIDEKVDAIILEKYPDKWLSQYGFWDPASESHQNTLILFKYLYSLGGDAHIYLWNRLIAGIIHRNLDVSSVSKEEFSDDEWRFIESLIRQHAENVSKWGENYTQYDNINNFSSERLSLIPWTSELNKEYINHFLKEIKEYESFFGMDCNNTSQIAQDCLQSYRPLSFAIILKDSNELIGETALQLIKNDALYNLEYYIFPEYRKRGYAYEAVSLLINKAVRRELIIRKETVKVGVYEEEIAPIKCIEAKIRSSNTASIRLVEKLGFEKTGVLPFYEKRQGSYYDGVTYHFIV